MPITYKHRILVKAGLSDGSLAPLTDANSRSFLLLWLLMTTNSDFLNQLQDAETQTSVAEELETTPVMIELFLAKVKSHHVAVAEVQTAFQELAQDDDYQGLSCPSSMSVITGL